MEFYEDLVSTKKFLIWKLFGSRKYCNYCEYLQAIDKRMCGHCYKYDNYLPAPNADIPEKVRKFQKKAEEDYKKEKMRCGKKDKQAGSIVGAYPVWNESKGPIKIGTEVQCEEKIFKAVADFYATAENSPEVNPLLWERKEALKRITVDKSPATEDAIAHLNFRVNNEKTFKSARTYASLKSLYNKLAIEYAPIPFGYRQFEISAIAAWEAPVGTTILIYESK